MLNNFFDHIYCLNLDRRNDRWESVQQEFLKLNIKPERISAIDGKNLKFSMQNDWSETTKACAAININCIHIFKNAKERGFKNILIFEDDITFDINFNKIFKSAIEQLPENWEMLYLGGCHKNDPIVFSRNLHKPNNLVQAHAIGFREILFDRIIERLCDLTLPVDEHYDRMGANRYIIEPMIARQKAGYSDTALAFLG